MELVDGDIVELRHQGLSLLKLLMLVGLGEVLGLAMIRHLVDWLVKFLGSGLDRVKGWLDV